MIGVRLYVDQHNFAAQPSLAGRGAKGHDHRATGPLSSEQQPLFYSRLTPEATAHAARIAVGAAVGAPETFPISTTLESIVPPASGDPYTSSLFV